MNCPRGILWRPSFFMPTASDSFQAEYEVDCAALDETKEKLISVRGYVIASPSAWPSG